MVAVTFDARSLLPYDELTKSRTPAELAAWVAERCEAISLVEAAREAALMHHRPFKEFYEEIFPLSLWVTRHYQGREDVWVTPNLDNRSFDAVVHDGSVSESPELLVEITTAQAPNQHLYMEYFVKH